jgi:ABC-type proline/glycine betaine transport system substrate-binding protein
MAQREAVIRCDGIWKIFGDRSRQAMRAVQSEDIDMHVADWIAAHQAEYDGWLEAARAAAIN